jgi:hypothetical protein
MKDGRRPSIRVQAGVSSSCSHMDIDGGAVGEPPFSEFVAPPHERRASREQGTGRLDAGRCRCPTFVSSFAQTALRMLPAYDFFALWSVHPKYKS